MDRRLELHELLKEIIQSDQVYFQPPPTIQMTYPSIVYKKDDEKIESADNRPYTRAVRWLVTVIDRDPDSEIPKKISELPLCVFNRFYTSDNLNHNVYKLFF